MYTLKAFAQVGAFVDNDRTDVALVGELSPLASTYAREKEYHSNLLQPNISLVVFSSLQDGVDTLVDVTLANKLLDAIGWVVNRAQVGDFDATTTTFHDKFLLNYDTQWSLYNVGAMVLVSANVFIPSSIQLRLPGNDTDTYTVWFANAAFEQQYDEYHLEVIPPIDNLDVFFQGSSAIQAALAARTLDATMNLIKTAKGAYPETELISLPFDWVDPAGIAAKIPTQWPVVQYGIAGNNIDAQKEAIRTYILANSSHTQAEWETVFPDIFTATEFIIVPLWDKYAVPNKILETGLYSSISLVTDAVTQLKRMVRGDAYTQAWIDTHAEIMATTYKAVNAAVVGGPKNRDGIYQLYQRYSDYMAIPSTDTDFLRMAPATRDFVLILTKLFEIAETMTPDSVVPIGYTRLIRDGVLYVVKSVDKFQYLVASKYSVSDSNIGLLSATGEPTAP